MLSDIFSIIAYLVLCLVIGLWGIRNMKTFKDFALGSKKISTGALVSTLYATYLGAGATFGLIEQINNIGIVCVFVAGAIVLQWYITKTIFCKKIAKFKGCVSQSHIMGKLYGPSALWVCNMVNVIFSIGVVAIQIAVIGLVAQNCLHLFKLDIISPELSPRIGIFIGAGVVMMYSALGGVRAVILTDIMQAVLFFIIILIVLTLSVDKFYIKGNFLSDIPDSKLWIVPYNWHTTLLVIGMFTYALIPSDGCNASAIQRMLISGSSNQLQKAYSIITFIDFMVIMCISTIAVLLMPITGEGTLTRTDIFQIIGSNMPSILVGITIVGIMAITMSTADSWLNTGSVIVTHDIVKQLNIAKGFGDKQELMTAKCVTASIGAIATYFALSKSSILSMLLLVENFNIPLIFVPLAAGFLGYNGSEKDFKRSVILALTGVFLGRYLEGEFGFISLLFGLIGSAIGLFFFRIVRFRLPTNPLSKLGFLRFKKINLPFFTAVISLSLLAAVIHLYLEEKWKISDLGILFAVVIILYRFHPMVSGKSKLLKKAGRYSLLFLITGVTGLYLQTAHNIVFGYLILVITFGLIYAQLIPIFAGLTLGVLLAKLPFVIAVIPTFPLSIFWIFFSIIGVLCLSIYIKDIKNQLRKAEFLATTDQLTKLNNRHYMNMRFEGMIKKSFAKSEPLSVMVIDVDYFKKINDTYGHQVGDKVLSEIGRRISAHFNLEKDLCIRTGGEEFLVVMPNLSLKLAEIFAENLRHFIEENTFLIGSKNNLQELKCTVSIGLAGLNKTDTAITLAKRADKALYHAKRQGRNRVIILEENPSELIISAASNIA